MIILFTNSLGSGFALAAPIVQDRDPRSQQVLSKDVAPAPTTAQAAPSPTPTPAAIPPKQAPSKTPIPGTSQYRAGTPRSHPTRSPSSPDLATASLQAFTSYNLQGGYVAAGVGMRNLGYGTISLQGIPSGSQVVAAYL